MGGGEASGAARQAAARELDHAGPRPPAPAGLPAFHGAAHPAQRTCQPAPATPGTSCAPCGLIDETRDRQNCTCLLCNLVRCGAGIAAQASAAYACPAPHGMHPVLHHVAAVLGVYRCAAFLAVRYSCRASIIPLTPLAATSPSRTPQPPTPPPIPVHPVQRQQPGGGLPGQPVAAQRHPSAGAAGRGAARHGRRGGAARGRRGERGPRAGAPRGGRGKGWVCVCVLACGAEQSVADGSSTRSGCMRGRCGTLSRVHAGHVGGLGGIGGVGWRGARGAGNGEGPGDHPPPLWG